MVIVLLYLHDKINTINGEHISHHVICGAEIRQFNFFSMAYQVWWCCLSVCMVLMVTHECDHCLVVWKWGGGLGSQKVTETGLQGHYASLLLCVAMMCLLLIVGKGTSSCCPEDGGMVVPSMGNACPKVAHHSSAVMLSTYRLHSSGLLAMHKMQVMHVRGIMGNPLNSLPVDRPGLGCKTSYCCSCRGSIWACCQCCPGKGDNGLTVEHVVHDGVLCCACRWLVSGKVGLMVYWSWKELGIDKLVATEGGINGCQLW